MSLINDVLRDLDARGAAPPLAGAPLRVPAGTGRARRRRLWPWLTGLLMVMLAVTALLWRLQPQPAATSPASASSEALATPAASTSSVPEPPAAAPQAQQATVAPVQIIPLEVAPETVVEGQPQAEPAPRITPPVPAPPASTPASAPSVAVKATEAPAPRIERIARTSSAPLDATRSLQRASDALAQGQAGEAEELLRDILASDADAVRARLALAALYQQQGRDDAALALWRTGLQRDSSNPELAEALARALLSRSQPDEAASALATAAPPLAQRPDFHALLAYAWQQAGQPARAAEVYLALVAFDDRQGRWWLGLATAEEARGESASALAAFRRARDSANLEISVLRYVDQRIAALEAISP